MFTVTRVRIGPAVFLAYCLGLSTTGFIALAARIILELGLRKTRKGA
ncbi:MULTISPECIES: hypothetical protein [unclassified Nocardioides]|nr:MULTISPECIES: hypothetical protein [unclassified Nocardioides]GAW50630.1 uncharacterized protein PD653B2_2966 [Nocardioides sp. PD653-B2]GAW55529.1 uncharacterized protein PD653_2954 [Nocardioides sp. PD653]